MNLLYTQFVKNQCHHRKTYPAVDDVARREWCQQACQIGHAVGEGHEYSCEPRRDVKMVDLKPRVDTTIESNSKRENGDCQVLIASRVGSCY